ncbi:DEAD/DEAH box helicase family protein [Maribellus maritimus]|uniref:DEAD/DEAH box helicase family protein n=1 Tax=Maribellus maritimus TaxID=2870838 RepID=UPI001EEB7B54|nr:DEAD/DEAH box helicase family protein [Maribellus maritimus]MCG6188945.1 DEAD/DEAH box helicase family protein [Maribellus maritimus]
MNELDLQDKYLVNFLCERSDGLQYKEVKANTVSPQFFIVEDLKQFISDTTLNRDNYRKLLRKFGDEKKLLTEFMDFLNQRVKESMNMAIFINNNKSVTFEGIKLHLFYPSGSETYEDKLFDENIFSVVQELPYTFRFQDKQRFSFRPDLSFFLNGIYLGYSELKSNYNNQNARRNGRNKVAKDYLNAVQEYLVIADNNDLSFSIRKDFLKIFEKAIHITSTDINETYIIRNIANQFDEIKNKVSDHSYDFDDYNKKLLKDFKTYPLRNPKGTKTERFEEVFKALYDKKMIEREILYYNFIERELIKKEGSKTKEYKHNDGRLISPRPKQKFGTDKILSKIDEFLSHENEPDYFINKLRKELKAKGVGEKQAEELITKRQKYQNNKTVYSLLLQYAAGFGKSNIIGWTALQLKDLRKNSHYVYDKVMLVVDRVQLRDQLDSKMFNMNISNKMFIEANDKKSFLKALNSDTRIVVVNVQKFTTIKDVLAPEIVKKLASLRIAFLIDEIHRSNSGVQHEEMISLFDELQSSFDNNNSYKKQQQKKNLIIGFTATPSDHSLARFGEFNKYAEAEKIWVPFDYYTMREAIEDGYILNPIKGIVPVSAKMFFELPDSEIKGFEGDFGYETIPDDIDTGIDEYGRKYAIRKKKIYENDERIKAVSKFVVERLVSTVYHQIRGTAKAMLAVSSIKAAIRYKKYTEQYFSEITKEKKYERFKDAPVYIVYSESQDYPSSNSLNGGISEEKVLQNFAIKKNGLIIVVDKLQTGFDEPKLHTLFLDKEIRSINAIQTISRVNRTTKYKNDCKIIDFSYKNINVENIKAAFEHFSNVVVSDFDPLGDEEKLDIFYQDLKQHSLFLNHFEAFTKYESGDKNIETIIELENSFSDYITGNPKESKELKSKINQYFRILNLIEFVIHLDKKYSEEHFLNFWRRFNNEYNNINRQDEIIDDVEIYFDNKIGIVAPVKQKVKEGKKAVTGGSNGASDNQYKYNILKVIEKRNQEEEAIEELIKDFESKIDLFFDYLRNDSSGIRVIAKIQDDGSAFDSEEIYDDFAKIYRKFIRRNKDLGEFFIRETQDSLNQLCDDFERTLKTKDYSQNDQLSIAAEAPTEFILRHTGYMFLDSDNYIQAENTFIAYKDFAEILGFDFISLGEFQQGSWIRKGIVFTRKAANSKEAKELIDKGKKALELAYLEKVQSEVTKNNSEAAKALMDAVKEFPNAAIKMDSLIIIKTTVDNIPNVVILKLTMEQVIKLDKNPEIMNNPVEVMKYLNS